MIKTICTLVVAALFSLSLVQHADAEQNSSSPRGAISTSALAAMGLSPLRPMSDAQGAQIRGSFVVWGAPGSDFFVTDVSTAALDHSHGGASMPGQVQHDKANKVTSIHFNPNFGSKSVGPGTK